MKIFLPVGRLSFVLLVSMLVSAFSGVAADVEFIGMRKYQSFTQENSGAPEPGDAYGFDLGVDGQDISDVSEATLISPDNSETALDFDDDELGLHLEVGSLAELNEQVPAGNYRINLVTVNDGTRNVTLPMADAGFPTAPRLSNWEAAQAIDPLKNFRLRWDPFVGGTASDFIAVEVIDSDTQDKVFETPDVMEPGALNGTVTNVVIPPGTLAAPTFYYVNITFYKLLTRDTTTYPGVLAVSALASQTQTTVQTIITAPVIVTEPQPANQTVTIGATATFTVVATGTNLSYQWYDPDGNPIGEDSPVLELDDVQPSQSGNYYVVVENEGGIATSQPATLTVVCGFVLIPSSALFSSVQSEGTISVSSDSPICEWTVENTNSWIHVTEDSGLGDGTVSFEIDQNTNGVARFGFLTIAGQRFSVIQTADFAPESLAGRAFTITINGSVGTLPGNGRILFMTSSTTNNFKMRSLDGGTDASAGAYVYEKTAANSASVTIGASVILFDFETPVSGMFHFNDGAESAQEGTFVMAPIRGDFNANMRSDIVAQRTGRLLEAWFMNGTNAGASVVLAGGKPLAAGWKAIGCDDFNRDGQTDILLQHTTRKFAVWFMNGTSLSKAAAVRGGAAPPEGWRGVNARDYNGDGSPDILIQHDNGKMAIWYLNNTNFVSVAALKDGNPVSTGWRALAAGDMLGDGSPDVVMQHSDGRVAAWNLVGGKFHGAVSLRNGKPVAAGFVLRGVNDFNDDGKPDLLFQHSDTRMLVWLMDGSTFVRAVYIRNAASSSRVVGPN